MENRIMTKEDSGSVAGTRKALVKLSYNRGPMPKNLRQPADIYYSART